MESTRNLALIAYEKMIERSIVEANLLRDGQLIFYSWPVQEFFSRVGYTTDTRRVLEEVLEIPQKTYFPKLTLLQRIKEEKIQMPPKLTLAYNLLSQPFKISEILDKQEAARQEAVYSAIGRLMDQAQKPFLEKSPEIIIFEDNWGRNEFRNPKEDKIRLEEIESFPYVRAKLRIL